MNNIIKRTLSSIILFLPIFVQANSLNDYQLKQFYKNNNISNKAKSTKELNSSVNVASPRKEKLISVNTSFEEEQQDARLKELQNKREKLYKRLAINQDIAETFDIEKITDARLQIEEINNGKCIDRYGHVCSRPKAKRIKQKLQEYVESYDSNRSDWSKIRDQIAKLDKKIEYLKK